MGFTAVFCVGVLSSCTHHDQKTPPASPSSQAAGPCPSQIKRGELPAWASGGFKPGDSVPYVVGDQGRIVAVLFGDPLHSPPLPGRSSKILWIARPGTNAAQPATQPTPGTQSTQPAQPTDLEIKAQLDKSSVAVTQEVSGGPGPSIVDMPQPGCWRMHLSWSGQTDDLAITYQPG